MSKWLLGLSAWLVCVGVVLAGDPAPNQPQALNGAEIRALVAGNTTDCLKVRDDSTCATYFAADGVIKRIMDDDGARRDGTWTSDDDLLCVLWAGKENPLCFVVMDMRDGTYELIKQDHHKSTITRIIKGNSRGL